MPFALLIIGLVLIVAAIHDTQDILVTLIAADFTGTGNFIYWVAAILLIGAVGYVPKAKPVSDGLLLIVLLALFLSRGKPSNPGGGFFKQFQTALGATNVPTTPGSGGLPGPVVSGALPGAGGRTPGGTGISVRLPPITLPGGIVIGAGGTF